MTVSSNQSYYISHTCQPGFNSHFCHTNASDLIQINLYGFFIQISSSGFFSEKPVSGFFFQTSFTGFSIQTLFVWLHFLTTISGFFI